MKAKKVEPQESDQDKSNRQWRENYQRTVSTEDLATLSTGQIEQAINYAAKQASNLGPKAWAGDEEAKKLITAFQREEELMKFHLKTRKTNSPKPEAAPKPKRPPKSFRAKQMVTTTVLVEETGKFEKREIDAETAMVALDADINELEAFLKCLKG